MTAPINPVKALAAAVFLSSVFAPTPAAGQNGEAVGEEIRRQVEQIRTMGQLSIEGSDIASVLVLPELYERRRFGRAWTDPATISDLLRSIDDSVLDGLDPDDYHRQALLEHQRRVREAPTDAALAAAFDLLLTDALVRLGYHLLFGKVDPERLDPNWNLIAELGDRDPTDMIEEAIASGRLYDVIEAYKPRDPFYVQLKAALADYRAVRDRGGWESVPDIRRLELDSVDARVPALRARLSATGDMPAGAYPTSLTFDADVELAVKAFQRRHGLTDDGIVGRNTVAAMNVPVHGRIDQIRVNLERGRWTLRELGDDFVLVNIAGFQVYVVEDRETVWTSRVVVGSTYHRTPLFQADMNYLVLNPTWTVPPGIIAGETLPGLKSDPTYLADHNMSLLDRSGNVIDPSTVNFFQYSARNFPYIVRQEPGPWNALGQVKFIFPNQHFVFLHDTPSRNLFGAEVRTFSHGCIRVENPLDLAEVLLRKQSGWDRTAIDRQVASADLKTVYLDEPLPTLLLYWTAWVDPSGQLTFYPDVYDRDGAILEGLNEDFRFRDRPVIPG